VNQHHIKILFFPCRLPQKFLNSKHRVKKYNKKGFFLGYKNALTERKNALTICIYAKTRQKTA